MKVQEWYELKDMLCHEVDDLKAQGNMSMSDLEKVHKLTDTIKNIDKIVMIEDGGYSGDGDWTADIRGSYGNSYRGRQRDSMGRYSGYTRRYYRDSIKDELRELMDKAGTEKERKAIERCMESMD